MLPPRRPSDRSARPTASRRAGASRRRGRRAGLLLGAAAVVLAGCGNEPEPEAAPAPDEAPVDPETGIPQDDPFALDVAPEEQGPTPQIEDGLVRAEGVVVPVPDGWLLDERALDQGLIGLRPDEDPPTQFVLAAGGIDTSPVFGVEGLDYDQILEAFRSLAPDGVAADEEIELDGAQRAHLLRFDDIVAEEGQEPTDEVLILADAEVGRVALFNYAAPSASFDESVVDALRENAAIDPDSEPLDLPVSPPPGQGGEGQPGTGNPPADAP